MTEHIGLADTGSRDPTRHVNDRTVLQEDDCFDKTARAFSNRKKWWVLTVMALCQTSMNFNAAVYSNAVDPLNQEFNISNARHGMIAFLVTYAFACEAWAPWSEELGRWIIMQLSLGLVNVFAITGGVAPSWKLVLAARVLGGFSSAGGSVTLGVVADMFDTDDQQFAVLWVALWSCSGAVIGGILGGPIEHFLPWRWNFYIQIIFGVVVQLIHFFGVPETRSTVRLDSVARKRRKNHDENAYGPNEAKSFSERFSWSEISRIIVRPYQMLAMELIVLLLSLLSGFSDALVFSFLESYGFVFDQWGFNKWQMGMALSPLAIGYTIAYFSFFPVIKRHNWKRQNGRGHELTPESRLWWLMFTVPTLPIGLLGFALTCTGPSMPWIAPLLFSLFIGIANLSIYYATIDYMVAAYDDQYAASATGGNGFARDLLAGMCAIYTKPLYSRLGLKNASLLLFGLSVFVCVPVYIFYRWGEWVRLHSKFAQDLAQKQTARKQAKENAMANHRESLVARSSAEP
ncbi:major facilitator superfamily domain-containing protein [Lophiotrema nucula]|uniref:Major facilitator superfamily domain-containing protein n=1 Tax=Lophiotrema nucula TaxID=690887 RepID=A0A6A5YVC1_9PLEO|nr:major facilitator superfamily domain-containing protein [Lophiotrema nucula]